MASSNRNSSDAKASKSRVVYQEFGNNKPAAVERAVPELPISQQNLKVQETAGAKANRNCNQWLSSEARNFSGSTETVETQCGTGGTVKGRHN